MSRILLVDDDTQVNEVMKATLEVLGHQVMSVDDPVKVADAFSSFQPDVTLIDYMLPGCTGLDVIQQLDDPAQHSVLFLATGMADFGLLRRALDAGASSLLGKPYRISDLVALLELAGLLSAAVKAETQTDAAEGDCLRLTCTADDKDNSLQLGQIIAFAHQRGADHEVTTHRLPLVASALMKNARTHGCPSGTGSYQVEVQVTGSAVRVRVSDQGPGFDWQKAIARARSCMEKPCASGLQLVIALCDELQFENDGRFAIALLSASKRDAG